jgi:hypothetical protein
MEGGQVDLCCILIAGQGAGLWCIMLGVWLQGRAGSDTDCDRNTAGVQCTCCGRFVVVWSSKCSLVAVWSHCWCSHWEWLCKLAMPGWSACTVGWQESLCNCCGYYLDV